MNTSSLDYLININNIQKETTIIKYNKVEIYIATWRKFQTVCIKQIENDTKVHNELVILSKCIHPKIVQFLGASRDLKYTYIMFEYMEKGNLEEYLINNALTYTEKYTLMLDIAIGLNYLHNRDPEIILHRDLKPANILINKHGEAKISDFGISKLINTEKSDLFNGHTGETGTYIWMAPEVLKHEEYNYKSDIYCLGLIFYFIWTERKPFIEYEMNTIQLMFAKFQNKLQVNINDNTQLDKLISKCCCYEKNDRPTSNDIIEELMDCL